MAVESPKKLIKNGAIIVNMNTKITISLKIFSRKRDENYGI